MKPIAFLFSMVFLLIPTVHAREIIQFNARVTAVHDGDTVRVTDQNGQKHRIRLAYIDAPELNQADGYASKQALTQMILHQNVHITVFDIDQYKRKVAQITLNSQDINLQQIQYGNAWHYEKIARKHQNPLNYYAYTQAQKQAEFERIGLWQNRQPERPWAFRYQQRNMEY